MRSRYYKIMALVVIAILCLSVLSAFLRENAILSDVFEGPPPSIYLEGGDGRLITQTPIDTKNKSCVDCHKKY